MRILLTGSSGTIGTPITVTLSVTGHEGVYLERNQPVKSDAGTARSSKDLRFPGIAERAIVGVHRVIHLTAMSRAWVTGTHQALTKSHNLEGTRLLLVAIASRKERPWTIFLSSRDVYGDCEDLPVSESHNLRPKGVYGRTKVLGEDLVSRHSERTGERSMILRLTDVYEPRTDHPDRLVPAFTSAAPEVPPLEVRGPDQVVDILHVDDTIRAFIAAVSRLPIGSASSSKTFNVPSGVGTQVGDPAVLVRSITASESQVRVLPAPRWSATRFVVDGVGAREPPGWTPRIGLWSGLPNMFRASHPIPA